MGVTRGGGYYQSTAHLVKAYAGSQDPLEHRSQVSEPFGRARPESCHDISKIPGLYREFGRCLQCCGLLHDTVRITAFIVPAPKGASCAHRLSSIASGFASTARITGQARLPPPLNSLPRFGDECVVRLLHGGDWSVRKTRRILGLN